jgi:hypothetical protein
VQESTKMVATFTVIAASHLPADVRPFAGASSRLRCGCQLL